jgi:hypothetical protein
VVVAAVDVTGWKVAGVVKGEAVEQAPKTTSNPDTAKEAAVLATWLYFVSIFFSPVHPGIIILVMRFK